MSFYRRTCKGFTLVELIVVMAVIAVLTSFAIVNLSTIQHKTYLAATIDVFLSDYKQQQIKAMTGDTDGTSATQFYGIYLEQNQYTLFRGTSYSASEPSNFVVPLDGRVAFSTINVPQAQIVFAPGSGEVSNYSPTQNTVILLNIDTNEQKTLTINRYGIITNIN